MLELLEDLGLQHPEGNKGHRYPTGLYKCECGNKVKIRLDYVWLGKVNSCGNCKVPYSYSYRHPKHPKGVSGYFGVSKSKDLWAAHCDSVYLGVFNTPLEAAEVYDNHVLEQAIDRPLNGVI